MGRRGRTGSRRATVRAWTTALVLLVMTPPPGWAQTSPARRAIVERVEWEVSDTGARVIIVVKGKVDYSTHTAGAAPEAGLPPRAYVDLKPARLGSAIAREPIPVDDRLVRRIRIGQFQEDTARIVVDLSQPAYFHVTTAERPTRLILKLVPPRSPIKTAPPERRPRPGRQARGPARWRGADARPLPAPPRPAPPPPPPPPTALPTATSTALPTATPTPGATRTPRPRPSATPAPTARRHTVVLDPGHGGKDPGARGVSGEQEKVLTLAIARRVADRLREEPGVEVILTRSGDQTVSLEERTALANAKGADLFVSIHANASEGREAAGIETYTLNNSEDQATTRLAALENGLSFAGAAPDEGDLAVILSDLLQTGKEDESIALAEAVQESLVRYLQRRWRNVNDLGVKKGPFYVLVGAYMPCVLVEVGFLTHPSEGQRIAAPRYQRDLAEGISQGIRRFLASGTSAGNL